MEFLILWLHFAVALMLAVGGLSILFRNLGSDYNLFVNYRVSLTGILIPD